MSFFAKTQPLWWPLFLLVFGWLVKKYLIPWFGEGLKLSIAKRLVIIADDVTDWLVEQNPDAKWDNMLDEAVDKIAAALGVKDKTARRAAIAAFARKKRK